VRNYGIVALPIYLSHFVHIIAMSGFEWEIRRIPRASGHLGIGLSRPRPGPIAEYVALEFPRETVTWVLNARSHDLQEASRADEADPSSKLEVHRPAKA